MDHTSLTVMIVFLAPVIGAYLEKHYGWWSWVEDTGWQYISWLFMFSEK